MYPKTALTGTGDPYSQLIHALSVPSKQPLSHISANMTDNPEVHISGCKPIAISTPWISMLEKHISMALKADWERARSFVFRSMP